jgi:hypothetical protein
MLVTILAVIGALIAGADIFFITYVIKKTGTHGIYRSGPLDHWCDQHFGAWWVWRLLAQIILLGAVAWFGSLSIAIIPLCYVITAAAQNAYLAWQTSRTT